MDDTVRPPRGPLKRDLIQTRDPKFFHDIIDRLQIITKRTNRRLLNVSKRSIKVDRQEPWVELRKEGTQRATAEQGPGVGMVGAVYRASLFVVALARSRCGV